jgi:hypothetical protein
VRQRLDASGSGRKSDRWPFAPRRSARNRYYNSATLSSRSTGPVDSERARCRQVTLAPDTLKQRPNGEQRRVEPHEL